MENNIDREYSELQSNDRYHFGLLISALCGLFFYYFGSFLILAFRQVNGQTVSALPLYPISWELAFSDFGQLLENLLLNVFGYFVQYARLFGFFQEPGVDYQSFPAFLLPVDILIKFVTIVYFHFFWMPWDTKRVFRLGYFNSRYPYADKVSPLSTNSAKRPEPPQDLDHYLNYQDELNRRAQALKMQAPKAGSPHVDDDDDEDDSVLPFGSVHKPLEEFYYRHEVAIYGFVRTRLLPGSNLLLVLYYSTLFVIDLRAPWTFFLYVIGVMSLFWCMQTFLLVLDHNHYPPEDDHE